MLRPLIAFSCFRREMKFGYKVDLQVVASFAGADFLHMQRCSTKWRNEVKNMGFALNVQMVARWFVGGTSRRRRWRSSKGCDVTISPLPFDHRVGFLTCPPCRSRFKKCYLFKISS